MMFSRIRTWSRFVITASAALAIPSAGSARRNCGAALQVSAQLSSALVSRDTASIKTLVDSVIGYGHSNGWIETRTGMIRDLYDGTLRYEEIRLLDSPSCVLNGNTAIVRHRVGVAIEMRGTKLRMNLGVLQIWTYRKGNWTLIARQSCKIS